MVSNVTTEDITMEEARLLDGTGNDFFEHGKTDVKCPRCGSTIITEDFDTSYTIGCEHGCIKLDYRGI